MFLEWIMERRKEVFVLKKIFKDIPIALKLENLDFSPEQHAEMFTLKTHQVEDPVISTLQKNSKFETTNKLWTTFDVLTSSRQDQEAVRGKLEIFSNRRIRSGCCFLVTSEKFNDGVIQYQNRPFQTSIAPSLHPKTASDEIVKQRSTASTILQSSSKLSGGVQAEAIQRSGDDKPKVIQQFSAKDELSIKQSRNAEVDQAISKVMQNLQLNKTVSDAILTCLPLDCTSVQSIQASILASSTLEINDDVIKADQKNTYADIYQGKPFDRVAEEFANKSQLVKKGKPAVYLLKSDERVNRSGGLRWFDIGKQLPGNQRAHKVIILMGATGSGKSTLIDGMVNYILGVEWNDDFRFRIVHDGASDQGKSQAHSQTSSVTAYTIHHVEGMKIPYGITIIDTPGYGDTGGVERDEEITRIITRFLCHPETNQHLDFVNAVCFVASSADSRLTPTQQYILDSASSIFGKNIRDHLQLLVTFSDGMPPPVLEAIRQAGVPGLSNPDSSAVRHHNFNNSALFAGNISGSNGTSFDEVFWNLGRTNFQSFFEKLSVISDQSLEQTQLIVKSKIELEKCLHSIDLQLEDICKKRETVEILNQSLFRLRHQIIGYENYEFLVEEPVLDKIPCFVGGLFAYNCNRCLQTCQKSISYPTKLLTELGLTIWRSCYKCSCPYSQHSFDSFEYLWEKRRVIRINDDLKTLYDVVSAQISTANRTLFESQQELTKAKEMAVALLHHIHALVTILENSSLQSSKIMSVYDYVESIKRRLNREHRPGFMTRVQLLDEIVGMMNSSKASN